MTHNCKCGGRLKRTDIIAVYDIKSGRTLYEDTDPLVAHWICDKCQRKVTQRKRQSNAKIEKAS